MSNELSNAENLTLIRQTATRNPQPWDGFTDIRFLLLQIDRLTEALLGLRNFTDDGGCWCDASWRRTRSHHDPTCIQAREVVAQIEEEHHEN